MYKLLISFKYLTISFDVLHTWGYTFHSHFFFYIEYGTLIALQSKGDILALKSKALLENLFPSAELRSIQRH